MFCTNWLSLWTLKSFKANKLQEENASELYKILNSLVKRAETPMPKLYIYEGILGAFATGRNHKSSAIAVSTGLLNE